EAVGALRALDARVGELEERGHVRAGRAEERFGHLVFRLVAVGKAEPQVHIGDAVADGIAKRDSPVAREVEILALRAELRDLEDAVFRLARELERTDGELR